VHDYHHSQGKIGSMLNGIDRRWPDHVAANASQAGERLASSNAKKA